MPSQKHYKPQEVLTRWVPPGWQNKDRYHLIIGNLPFGGDWRHLKDWLNVELARYAPPGQEEWYRVEHTSTLSIGTGWARVKGLDVFEAAIHIGHNVPFQERNLLIHDSNRTHWVLLIDTADRLDGKKKAVAPSYGSPIDQQPPDHWTMRVQYGPDEDQYYQMPLPYAQTRSISTQQAGTFSPAAYSTVATAGNYTFAQCWHVGYYDNYDYHPNQTSKHPKQNIPPSFTSPVSLSTAATPASTRGRASAFTEQRQVIIQNIPLNHQASPSSSSSSSSSPIKRKSKGNKPITGEDLRRLIVDVAVVEGYDDPSTCVEAVDFREGEGYALLQTTGADAACRMVAALDGRQWHGGQISAELGSDETTMSPSSSSLACFAVGGINSPHRRCGGGSSDSTAAVSAGKKKIGGGGAAKGLSSLSWPGDSASASASASSAGRSGRENYHYHRKKNDSVFDGRDPAAAAAAAAAAPAAPLVVSGTYFPSKPVIAVGSSKVPHRDGKEDEKKKRK